MKHENIYALVYKKDFFNSLNIYAKYFDEPFADYSALAGFKVSEMASNYTKVVLSGDGGDEIFGGYPIYNAGLLYDKLLFIPKNVRKILLNSFNSIFKSILPSLSNALSNFSG